VLERIGLIVPSSNTTMETELPSILSAAKKNFTFHSSRVRMTSVDADGLSAMSEQTSRAASELADAQLDVVVYACLVAVMIQGAGAHEVAENLIRESLAESGSTAVVLSSAGALLAGLRSLGASRVALITPYVKELTGCVIDYLASSEIDVVDSVSLEISDNVEVGRIPNDVLEAAFDQLDLRGAEAVVVSACVQMPSLPLIERLQEASGLPCLSAATATAHQILGSMGHSTSLPAAHAGALFA
jgi:maleate isomerase